MLLFGCLTGLKILRADVTVIRQGYLRHRATDYLRTSTQMYSTRHSASPKYSNFTLHDPLAERIKQRTMMKREKKKPRQFTAIELEEEEKFEKFLAERMEKEEDTFGELKNKEQTEAADNPLSLHDVFTEEEQDKGVTKDLDMKKYMVPKGWTQEFGSLSTKDKDTNPSFKYLKDIKEEEKLEKIYNHIPLGHRNRRHEPDWYSRRIMKLGKQGHIAEAITVFDEWMIKEDRVKPTDFEYSVLIGILGKVGYTEKAFDLFHEMVRKKYRVHPKVITALFNACSNSPSRADGLHRAKGLRRFMLSRDLRPEFITYQAMMKAFGMCGDLKTALELGDESIHYYSVTENTLTSLLVACLSNKEAGFRHAVMVWQKFLKFGVPPCYRSYKLLLKITFDCGVGEQKLVPQLLAQDRGQTIDTSSNQSHLRIDGMKDAMTNKDSICELSDSTSTAFDSEANQHVNIISTDMVTQRGQSKTPGPEELIAKPMYNTVPDEVSMTHVDVYKGINKQDDHALNHQPDVPNVLDPNSDFSQIISFGKVKTSQDRFALLGGFNGFLKMLKKNKIGLDLEFFTLMMKLVPVDETDLVLDAMIKKRLKPDTVFFNTYFSNLLQGNDKSMEEIITVMNNLKISPEIRTFGVLASRCLTEACAESLFTEMEKWNFMPNIEIFLALMRASYLKFEYKKYILMKMSEYDVKPDKNFIIGMEYNIAHVREIIIKMDKEGNQKKNSFFIKRFESYLTFYEKWAKTTDLKKEEEDPWKSFKPP